LAGFRAPRRSAADEALVRSVFEEHGRALWAYATRLLGDRQAADEVVQEALVRAWRNPRVLAGGKWSVRGWLLTVTRNLAADRIPARAASSAPAPARTMSSMSPPDRGRRAPETDPMAVMQALGRLTTEQRDVLVEMFFRGSSVAETADNLGLPAETVRSLSYQALRALRQGVGPAGTLEGASR
jgi:RNA polymerase sigma-70 factor, ECF subfamily